MNTYRAKALTKRNIVEGQLHNREDEFYIEVYEYSDKEDEFVFSWKQIDPSTLEVVKLDFTDTQKKILIQNGKYVLHDLMTDLSELINVYTRITFWDGKDFEDKEEFSKLVERVLLLHIEIILEKIKKASQLLKGI